tara:strand:+ start:711 stop:1070 length:360 start_codon:yes stop_codon:yes gene_type:complete
VRDEIGLEKAGRRIIPVGIGADRYGATGRRSGRRPAATAAARLFAHRREDPVDRCGADRFQPASNRWIKRQMPMALHGGNQHRDQRLQSLAADPVRSFPQDDQCFANRIVIQPAPRPGR